MLRLNETRIGAVLREGFAVRASTSTRSSPHAQHGAGLLIGIECEVGVTGPGGDEVRGAAVVVPPHLLHSVACPGPMLGVLYDPEALPRVADFARGRGGAFALTGGLAGRVRAATQAHRAALARPEVLEGLAHEAARWLAEPTSRRRTDARVARVLEVLRDPDAAPHELVDNVGLSAPHLRALFVRDVGLPIRTFRLWRRLLLGVAALGRRDATEAAHLAGFADLAHFSRTCRRMLGYSPSALSSGLLGASSSR